MKEPVKEIPRVQMQFVVSAVAARVLPGIDVSRFEIKGLDDDGPFGASVEGRVPKLLDDDGTHLVCRLPFPPSNLSAAFASEGERKLPFFFQQAFCQSVRVRLELPEGLELVDPPEGLRESFRDGQYLLAVEPDGARAWIIRSEIRMPPFVLEPREYAGFRDFCARVDEAERARLRFARR